MLPYMALVALNKETTSVLSKWVRRHGRVIGQWRAWILLVTTDAASNVVFGLACFSIQLFITLTGLVIVVGNLTGAATSERYLVAMMTGRCLVIG